MVVSYCALWHLLQKEEVTFKKSLHTAEQDWLDAQKRRERWKKYQAKLDPARLLFIDKT